MDYLVGHLIGDYLLQNDWQARNKTWDNKRWLGLLVALFHALLVTGAIFFCGWVSGRVWAAWKLLVIWLSHGLQDWTRFAVFYMKIARKFTHFALVRKLPPAYTWAIIVVDNTMHIALLFFLSLV